jgi:hypothetical protein
VLFADLTVEEHLVLFASFKGVPSKEIPAQVEEMIKEVGLTEKRKVRLSIIIIMNDRISVFVMIMIIIIIIMISSSSSSFHHHHHHNHHHHQEDICCRDHHRHPPPPPPHHHHLGAVAGGEQEPVGGHEAQAERRHRLHRRAQDRLPRW